MITKEQAITSLQKKLELIQVLGTVEDFNKWRQSTKMTLISIYGATNERVLELSRIEAYRDFGFGGTERVLEAKDEAQSFIGGLIEDCKDFGLLQKVDSKKDGVNVNVNQYNNQNQSTNVNVNLELFIEAIKDELKGGQVKELKAILDGDEEPEQKKKSFVEKIKSFGSDVASNILANVLTNPQVYEQVTGMF
ncbi:MAG: hypothetical protein HRT58_21945 [Crocinitomicaceae bacterium]|nr:hypothetical protein [Flavobacteriales bacterium]NQZ38338.1 hypothetical protein [Crocinitomicaceae bacterium]